MQPDFSSQPLPDSSHPAALTVAESRLALGSGQSSKMPLKKAASLGRVEPADMMGCLSLDYPIGVRYRVDADSFCSCLEGRGKS